MKKEKGEERESERNNKTVSYPRSQQDKKPKVTEGKQISIHIQVPQFYPVGINIIYKFTDGCLLDDLNYFQYTDIIQP